MSRTQPTIDREEFVKSNPSAETRIGFEVAQPVVAPAWMIGAATRMLDCWEPQLEWIRMPELVFPSRQYWVSLSSVERGSESRTVSALAGAGGRSQKWLALPGPFHDVRKHGWQNIAQAIFDGAMSSLACQHAASELGISEQITTIIPAKAMPYVEEVYRIFGIRTLATDDEIYGQRLQTNFDRVACYGLAQRLLPASVVSQLEADGESMPRKVYMARRSSRAVQNSVEVEALLFREGFTKIYAEDHAVIDQFRFLWHADTVIGIHGAALASLLLRAAMPTPRPVNLIEAFGPGYIVTSFRHVVAAIGGQWVGIRGRVTPQVVRDLDFRQGRGLWRRFISKLPGPPSVRAFFQEPEWQKTHQSSDLEIDPKSVAAALNVLKQSESEPPPRFICWKSRVI